MANDPPEIVQTPSGDDYCDNGAAKNGQPFLSDFIFANPSSPHDGDSFDEFYSDRDEHEVQISVRQELTNEEQQELDRQMSALKSRGIVNPEHVRQLESIHPRDRLEILDKAQAMADRDNRKRQILRDQYTAFMTSLVLDGTARLGSVTIQRRAAFGKLASHYRASGINNFDDALAAFRGANPDVADAAEPYLREVWEHSERRPTAEPMANKLKDAKNAVQAGEEVVEVETQQLRPWSGIETSDKATRVNSEPENGERGAGIQTSPKNNPPPTPSSASSSTPSRMATFVGTSGYSHDDWKGNFYPEKFSQKKMLGFYAAQFPTVEINYTFRSIPTEQALMSWAAHVPPSFRFALKAWQGITHFKLLQGVEEETDDFLSAVAILGERLGPILFQLPPNFAKDVPRLDAFLIHIAGRVKCAFEFRHPSWLASEVYNCLRSHSAVTCLVDGGEMVSTADWGYVRLAGDSYTDDDIRGWQQRIEANKWNEAYVYFMRSDAGIAPQLATRFHELIGV